MGELRVMTWNVQNLFPVGADAGPTTQSRFDAKIASLTRVVDAHEPHLLALQEVGDESALVALQSSLSHTMRNRVMGRPDRRGIRVAYLSTRKLRNPVDVFTFPSGLLPVQSEDDQPGPQGPVILNEMSRPALEVTIRANGEDVTVVNCHLKSKLLSFPPFPNSTSTSARFFTNDEGERARYGAYALYRRASEAATVRSHLNGVIAGEGRDRPILAVGDFNDGPLAATTQIIHGPPGSELGTTGFDRADQGDAMRLWNLGSQIPEERRFSRIYRGNRELIDHIFASHYLVTNDRLVSVDAHSASGALRSIDDDPSATRGQPGSDHAAILATFNF